MEGVNAYMSERARIYIKACWGASVGGKSCHPEKDPGHIVFRPLSACRSRDMIPIAIQNSKHQSLPPLLLPDVARTGPASMHTFYDNFRDPFRGAGGPGGGGLGVGVTLRGGGTSLGGGLGADLGAGRHPGRLLLNDPLPRAPPVLPGAAGGGLESLARLAAVSSDSYMRIGPSCDSCRLKKIKCDASVEVLFQDEDLVAFNGNRHESLHVAMTPAEARAALPSHVWDALPPHIVDALEAQDARRGEIVRHVDKVVFFRACASCTRRTAVGSGGKETDSDSGAASTPAAGPGSAPASPAVDSEGKADARSEPCCSFSKGFTRSDINVFTRLQKQLGARGQLADFTVADYRAIGY
ncbi:Zn(2)-C6 fungal-type domain-containing protein [Lachancea thermotolerans]